MIEQSTLNGPIYLSESSGKILKSQQLSPNEISFGPYKSIYIKGCDDHSFKYKYTDGNDAYHVINQEQHTCEDFSDGFFYNVGLCLYENKQHIYFIQNDPSISEPNLVMENGISIAPSSLIGYPYNQKFHIPKELVNYIGKDLPATYVDKFKRPLNPTFLKNKIYLPINIDHVNTTLDEITSVEKYFPVVVNFKNTDYAVVDLEPNHTSEELEKAESLNYFYKEDTPRGGKHYIIKTHSSGFKYRISENLEIINQSMCTLYGINPVLNLTNTDYEDLDSKKYTVIGNKSTTIIKSDKDYSNVIESLFISNKKSDSDRYIKNNYDIDNDASHADFIALYILYLKDIQPWLLNIPIVNGSLFNENDTYTYDDLPWILYEYAMKLNIIPYRDKHSTLRKGVPYLAYIASAVIDRIQNV